MTRNAAVGPRSDKPAPALPPRNNDGSSRAAPNPTTAYPSPETDNIDDAGEPWGNNFA